MKTFLYVGLGNVGEPYSGTRHNLGIETLRAWTATMVGRPEYQMSDWQEHPEYPAYELRITPLRSASSAGQVNQESRIYCLFPTTMMNDSGQAVAAYVKKTSIPSENVVVIHDDVELPLGEVQVTAGGSAKGHNGVRSIQQALGSSDFGRLRMGVGRPPEGMDLSNFVLQKFSFAEKPIVEEMIAKATAVLSEIPFKTPSPSEDRTPPSRQDGG